MENFEQFKQQKTNETLETMQNRIKEIKDIIYDLGIKMNFSEENGDDVTKGKLLQKINEYKNELIVWENAYKEKVRVLNDPNSHEEETVGTYKGPKIEITSMEEKLPQIIKQVDKALEENKKREEKKEEFRKISAPEKFLYRTEENIESTILEKQALENTDNEKNSIQKLKEFRDEYDKLMEEFKKKDKEANKNGTPLTQKEIDEFNKKIQDKVYSIRDYIKLN